jgi:Holliday junction resolvase-like predicted endonuclease
LGEIGLIILQCKEISYIDVKKREKQRLGRGKSRSGKAMS